MELKFKFKFKAGDLVEIINPDRHAFYLKHGRIKYAYQNISSHENMYNVSFRDDAEVEGTDYTFEENDLQLLEEVTTNEDSKISRVEQTHKNINEFRHDKRTQPTEVSLSIIAKTLIEINETLAIICDKL